MLLLSVLEVVGQHRSCFVDVAWLLLLLLLLLLLRRRMRRRAQVLLVIAVLDVFRLVFVFME